MYKKLSHAVRKEIPGPPKASRVKYLIDFLTGANSYAIILPALIVLFLMCLWSFNLPIYFVLDKPQAMSLIDRTISYVIGVFGVSVAMSIFIIVAYESAGHRGEFFSLIIQHTSLYPVIYGSLSLLSILSIILVLTESISDEEFFIRSSVLGISCFIIQLLLIGHYFRSIFRFFGSNFVQSLYLELLKNLMSQDLLEEIRNRFSVYLMNSYWKELGYKKQYLDPGSDWISVELSLKEILVVRDVNMSKLKKAKAEKDTVMIVGDIGIGTIVQKNSSFLYIHKNTSEASGTAIMRCFVFDSWDKKSTELKEYKERLQDQLIRIVNESNSVGVKAVLDAYYNIYVVSCDMLNRYNVEDRPEMYPSQWFSTEWKTIEGLDRQIHTAFERAIEKNDLSIVNEIISYTYRVLAMAIRQRNHIIFQIYITKFNWYFHTSRRHNYDYVMKTRLVRLMKDIIRFSIGIEFEQSSNQGDKARLNRFYYSSYYELSRLLKDMMDLHDWPSFKAGLNILSEFVESQINDSFDFDEELIRIQFENLPNKDEKIRELEKRAEVELASMNYYRLLMFGVFSWLLFLYNQKRITLDVAKECFDNIKLLHKGMHGLLKDLDYLFNRQFEILDWHNWELDEPPIGKTYAALDSRNWLTLGFAFILLKDNSTKFTIEDTNTSQVFEHYGERILNWQEELVKNSVAWLPLLGILDDQELLRRQARNQEFLEELKSRYLRNIDELIAAQPLSKTKVDSFVSSVVENWKNGGIAKRLANYFLIISTTQNHNNLKHLCSENRILRGFKMMFVDQNYQEIVFLYDPGVSLSELEDYEFFSLLHTVEPTMQISDVKEALDKLLDCRSANSKNTTVLFIPDDLLYSANSLTSSSDFIPPWRAQNLDRQIFGGYYRSVTIVPIHDKSLLTRVAATDFKSAFEWLQGVNDEFADGAVEILVKEVDEDQAKKIIEENSDLFVKAGKPMPFDVAMLELKKSVHVKICVHMSCNIKNMSEIDVALIDRK